MSPVMKMRSPTMQGEENPWPIPSAFHKSFGPPSGQDCCRPFSLLTPSRRGPRKWGQPGSGDAMTSGAEGALGFSARLSEPHQISATEASATDAGIRESLDEKRQRGA